MKLHMPGQTVRLNHKQNDIKLQSVCSYCNRNKCDEKTLGLITQRLENTLIIQQ